MFTHQAVGALESGSLMSALWITGIILVAYLATMWVAMVLWVYRDISSRSVDQGTRTGLTLLVAAFNIPGLLLYLALRPPEPLVESYNRQLESEAFLREIGQENACPQCQRHINASFIACPYCRARVQEPCIECHRNLQTSWTICPYCCAERTPAAARQRPTPAAPPARTPSPAFASVNRSAPDRPGSTVASHPL